MSFVSRHNFQELITTFVYIDFWAFKQVPLISTSSQHQWKAVKCMCFVSLDTQCLEEFVLQIAVLNDREFSIAKKESNSISRTGNTWFTMGIEVWSANRIFWISFWFAWYERKQILICYFVFCIVPTPAKHVLLVHLNLVQGLNIHQELKLRYISQTDHL